MQLKGRLRWFFGLDRFNPNYVKEDPIEELHPELKKLLSPRAPEIPQEPEERETMRLSIPCDLAASVDRFMKTGDKDIDEIVTDALEALLYSSQTQEVKK